MDKNKAYCPICNKEMNFDKQSETFSYNCKCYNERRFNYILLWCNKCQKFTQRRGLVKNKCNRCAVIEQHKTMKKNDPIGYSQRQSAATIKANESMKSQGKGVWSKEQHIMAEATKLKNGTSLSNPEFREKIGCNGNPVEVIERLKAEGKGIFSDECLKLKTERFNNYWNDPDWIEADKIRKQEIVKNQWKFEFKNKCNDLCEGLENCDKNCLKNKYGWCEMKQIDICSVKRPNFMEQNGILCYYDKSSKSYIPWDDYKLKFARKRLTADIQSFINSLKSIEDFKYTEVLLLPTFRDQDSDSWAGSRGTFEQSLIEQEISWCTYIKFYIDENELSKPLVVGKTGTILAKFDDGSNKLGDTDVCFSEWDPEDADCREGPARLFLYQNNLSWDKTQILIIPVATEQEAYDVEDKITQNFNLFQS